MPTPYAHLSLAHSCGSRLGISNNDFYLGAIMPDVRYFTKQPRNKTHFSIEHLNHIKSDIEVSQSFFLGYSVHLLIDDIWYNPMTLQYFKAMLPFVFRNKISIKIMEAIFEFYCLNLRPANVQLQSNENELTQYLDIQPKYIQQAVKTMQEYNRYRSMQIGFQMAMDAGIASADRLSTMKKLAHKIEHPLGRYIALFIIKYPTSRLYNTIIDQVIERVQMERED